MPLRGIDKDTKENIFSFQFKSRFELIKKHKNIICPISGGEMFPRFRKGFTPHFVRKNALSLDNWENESQAHILERKN